MTDFKEKRIQELKKQLDDSNLPEAEKEFYKQGVDYLLSTKMGEKVFFNAKIKRYGNDVKLSDAAGIYYPKEDEIVFDSSFSSTDPHVLDAFFHEWVHAWQADNSLDMNYDYNNLHPRQYLILRNLKEAEAKALGNTLIAELFLQAKNKPKFNKHWNNSYYSDCAKKLESHYEEAKKENPTATDKEIQFVAHKKMARSIMIDLLESEPKDDILSNIFNIKNWRNYYNNHHLTEMELIISNGAAFCTDEKLSYHTYNLYLSYFEKEYDLPRSLTNKSGLGKDYERFKKLVDKNAQLPKNKIADNNARQRSDYINREITYAPSLENLISQNEADLGKIIKAYDKQITYIPISNKQEDLRKPLSFIINKGPDEMSIPHIKDYNSALLDIQKPSALSILFNSYAHIDTEALYAQFEKKNNPYLTMYLYQKTGSKPKNETPFFKQSITKYQDLQKKLINSSPEEAKKTLSHLQQQGMPNEFIYKLVIDASCSEKKSIIPTIRNLGLDIDTMQKPLLTIIQQMKPTPQNKSIGIQLLKDYRELCKIPSTPIKDPLKFFISNYGPEWLKILKEEEKKSQQPVSQKSLSTLYQAGQTVTMDDRPQIPQQKKK